MFLPLFIQTRKLPAHRAMPDATDGTHEVTVFFSLNTTLNLCSNNPIVFNIPSAENYYINRKMSDKYYIIIILTNRVGIGADVDFKYA